MIQTAITPIIAALTSTVRFLNSPTPTRNGPEAAANSLRADIADRLNKFDPAPLFDELAAAVVADCTGQATGAAIELTTSAVSSGETAKPAPAPDFSEADQTDGPFGADGFRFRRAEVRFGRAALQRKLVLALWDLPSCRPRVARPVEDVISEVYGQDHDTSDAAFRQLCADTNRRLSSSSCSISITSLQGQVCLVPRSQ